MEKKETKFGYIVSLEDYLDLDRDEKYDFLMNAIYQSNLIEGITAYHIMSISEGEEIKLPPELTDHYSAFKYVLENYERNPSDTDIREMHHLLMDNLLKNAGEYRKAKVWVGGNGCPYYHQIPKLIKSFEEDMSLGRDMWAIHNKFETIHPFIDGNGRIGRLLLNWLSLKEFKEFIIVENAKKEFYYKNIQNFRETFKKENPKVKFYKNINLKSDLARLWLDMYNF